MPFVPQQLDLLLRQPGKTEHADLIGDMRPGPGRPLGLETLAQAGAHVGDAAAHGAQVVLPLGEEGGVVEDAAGDAGAVGRGVGDLGALQDGELGGDVGVGGGGVGAGGGHKVEGAGALAVETEVLGERLRDAQLEALVDEVAHGPGVAGEVAGRKTLVGAVEEGEQLAVAHDDGDLLPLVLGEVDAGGVVGAGVQQDDGAGRGGAQGGQHAVEVEALGLGGEVGVVGELEADVGEDLVVVGPGRAGEVDLGLGLLRVEFGQEEGAQMDGSSAGDGLEGCDLYSTILVDAPYRLTGGEAYSVLADGWTVGPDHELLGGGGVIGQTLDGEIFMVEIGVIANEVVGLGCQLCLTDAWTGECTFFTTGNTQGFALLSRYAPMTRSTFFAEGSWRKAWASPKRGSSGAAGTTAVEKTEGGLEPMM